MKFYCTFFIIVSSTLAGCSITGIIPDYVEPQDAKSYIKFSTSYTGDVNRRLYIHGEKICRLDNAKLVGLLNSKTIGLPSISNKELGIESNKKIFVSSPTAYVIDSSYRTATFAACQPLVSFYSEPGKVYSMQFSGCSLTSLVDEAGTPVDYEKVKYCKVSGERQSDTKPFYLTDPT